MQQKVNSMRPPARAYSRAPSAEFQKSPAGHSTRAVGEDVARRAAPQAVRPPGRRARYCPPPGRHAAIGSSPNGQASDARSKPQTVSAQKVQPWQAAVRVPGRAREVSLVARRSQHRAEGAIYAQARSLQISSAGRYASPHARWLSVMPPRDAAFVFSPSMFSGAGMKVGKGAATYESQRVCVCRPREGRGRIFEGKQWTKESGEAAERQFSAAAEGRRRKALCRRVAGGRPAACRERGSAARSARQRREPKAPPPRRRCFTSNMFFHAGSHAR